MDERIRQEAAAIFARLGLSEEAAVELFYKRTIAAGKMPFGPANEQSPSREKQKKKRMNERFAEWDAF